MAKQIKTKRVRIKTEEEQTKRNLKPKIEHWLIVILIIGIIIFGTYRYIEEEKEKAFIRGGQKAIDIIINETKANGGVGIQKGNETIILARYNKAATIASAETQTITESNQTTPESSNETSNQTTEQ